MIKFIKVGEDYYNLAQIVSIQKCGKHIIIKTRECYSDETNGNFEEVIKQLDIL
jgi:hypothetical protein